METLKQTRMIYNLLEFGIEKCVMLARKSEKKETAEGRKMTNQESMRTLSEKENYKYSAILEADTLKQKEMKEKNKKRVLKKNEKHLETKHCSRNFIKGISTWRVSLVI